MTAASFVLTTKLLDLGQGFLLDRTIIIMNKTNIF